MMNDNKKEKITIEISLEHLDTVYWALEVCQPVASDLLGEKVMNIADMGLMEEIRDVLFELREQDDRWVRAH